MTNLLGQYKIAEQSHGKDMLNLMLARGYIVRLMDNSRAMKYMQDTGRILQNRRENVHRRLR